MKHEGSLPCSQQPSSTPYSDPDEYSYNPYHYTLPFKTHFNIILPQMYRSS
jgi:hypothetical protein